MNSVRTCASRVVRNVSTVRPVTVAVRNSSTDAGEYKSPFTGASAHRTTKIPDFSKYKSSSSAKGNQVFGYFMVGTMGALSAAGAKATVQGEQHPRVTAPPDDGDINITIQRR